MTASVRRRRELGMRLLLLVWLAGGAGSALAQIRTWDPAVLSGDWSNLQNWTPADLPLNPNNVAFLTSAGNADYTVNYDLSGNQGAAQIMMQNDPAAGSGLFTLKFDQPSLYLTTDLVVGSYGQARIIQSSGTIDTRVKLELGTDASGNGTYQLDGGTLLTATVLVGNAGNGTVIQNGGTHEVGYQGLPNSFFYIDAKSGSTGFYSLSGGVLNSHYFEYIGNEGTGSFFQGGGTHTAEYLTLGQSPGSSGSYVMAGGSLVVNNNFNVGFYGDATFDQGGGSILYTGITSVPNDDPGFRIAAGASTVLWNMSGTATLTSQGKVYIGDSGNATFNQSGGTFTVPAESGQIYLALGFSSVSHYNLSGGVLNANIAAGYDGLGTFVNSGGTHTANFVQIGHLHDMGSSYTLSDAGTLTVGTINALYGSFLQTGGTLNVNSITLGSGTVNLSGGVQHWASDATITGSGGSLVLSADSTNDPAKPDLAVSLKNVSARFESSQHLRSLSLDGSTVLNVVDDAGSARVVVTPVLTINGNALLQLNHNGLVVDYSSAADSPMMDIRRELASAFKGKKVGITGGSGIALGYFEASKLLGLSGSDTGEFLGEKADATAILVSSSLIGDSNFDGKVDLVDLTQVARNYESSLPSLDWFDGDFNYDGKVNFSDLVMIARNYGASLPGGVAGASADFEADLAKGFANVPEPGAGAMICLGLCLAQRRRARN